MEAKKKKKSMNFSYSVLSQENENVLLKMQIS